MILREERPEDATAVRDLVCAAFAPMPFASGAEADLTPALRQAGALGLSLVADMAGVLVGHVALSPATHRTGATGWWALGPLSVAPGWQRRGIGTALVRKSQEWVRGHKAAGCILLGDTGYYPRFGFIPAPSHAPTDLPADHFMVWSLMGDIPEGRFAFHPAFDGV